MNKESRIERLKKTTYFFFPMIYTKLKELKKRQKRSNLSQTVKNDESSSANPKKLKWRDQVCIVLYQRSL
jgi:hypothetical protein